MLCSGRRKNRKTDTASVRVSYSRFLPNKLGATIIDLLLRELVGQQLAESEKTEVAIPADGDPIQDRSRNNERHGIGGLG